jgi:hypothetical protein
LRLRERAQDIVKDNRVSEKGKIKFDKLPGFDQIKN